MSIVSDRGSAVAYVTCLSHVAYLSYTNILELPHLYKLVKRIYRVAYPSLLPCLQLLNHKLDTNTKRK